MRCDLTLVVEALRGMEAVAEHINEMQKIYEEYGHVFDVRYDLGCRGSTWHGGSGRTH